MNLHTTAEKYRKIREDPQNTICFDCGHNDVTHSSVSLGILLCQGCASVHNTLVPEISDIKKIDNTYSSLDFQSLIMGGNASLKSFFAMYGISCNDSIEYKYRTKACAYYKEMLRMMVNDTPCSMLTPSESEGAELCSQYSLSFDSDNSIPTKDELTEEKIEDESGIYKALNSMKEKGMSFLMKFRRTI